MTDTTDNDRAEPMKELAQWLRDRAFNTPFPDEETKLRRWAAEVEASRPAPAPTDISALLKTPADFAQLAPASWDEDYRDLWIRLQVADANKMVYRRLWKSAVDARPAPAQADPRWA
jgi:hypothetical protein